MRTIKLTTTDGTDAGTISEKEDGSLSGTGRGQQILELAPDKSFDDWVEHLPHSKYLEFTVSE